jgi:hypothetical protein
LLVNNKLHFSFEISFEFFVVHNEDRFSLSRFPAV